MWIVFLGTSATVPTKQRSLPSIALVREGEILVFDVGEGTQMNMMRGGLSPMRVSRIFISHLHGDHVLGLPGLLQSMALNRRVRGLEVYGPRGVAELVELMERVSPYKRGYDIYVHEIRSSGVVLSNNSYEVWAVRNCHSIEGYAYIFKERDKPGKLDVEKLVRMGLPPGPAYRKLKMGEPVEVSGRLIRPDEVLGPPVKGVKVTYTGDTSPCPDVYAAAMNSDVLIHDSTFSKDEEEVARAAGHSTALDAARAALETNSRLLVLFHISARYTEPSKLFREASSVYPFTLIPFDLQVIRI